MDFTLAKDWRGEDPTGWFLSEKLNGWRGGWDGQALGTREGNVLQPAGLLAKVLPGLPSLDGELYLGRPDRLDRLASIIRSGRGWHQVRFHVFEAPEAAGFFEERQEWLRGLKLPAGVVLVPQVRCRGRAHLASFVEEIFARGGEGAVLRAAGSCYEPGRSEEYLRIKRGNWKRFKAAPRLSHTELFRILSTPHFKNPKAA